MYRYERKFKLSPEDYHLIKAQIELRGWFKQYPDRIINNIYLDNTSNSCFFDSIEGHLNKKKYRIRWYGELFTTNNQEIENSNFEIKIKRDALNYKKIFPLDKFSLPKNIIFSELLEMTMNLINDKDKEIENLNVKNFEPIFLNSYSREYYIDISGDIRLTIDRKQKFYSVHPIVCSKVNNNDVIVELKFNSKNLFNNFIIKSNLSQNSKFTNGVIAHFT